MLGELKPKGPKRKGLKGPKEPKGRDPLLHSEKTQGFAADPIYGRAKYLPMLGEIKTSRT